MVNAAAYYSDFRGEKSRYWVNMQHYLPKGWKVTMVYRYPWKFIDDADMKWMGSSFLYDDFRKLSQKEIGEAEKLCDAPFSLIRMMSKVAFLRYPDMTRLPDDEYIANCALAWHRFFKRDKTDVFLAGLIDETPGVIGLSVANKMGLKVVLIHSGKFSQCMHFYDGYYNYYFPRKLGKKEIGEHYESARKLIYGEKIINAQMVKIASEDRNLVSLSSLVRLARAAWRNAAIYHFRTPKDDQKLWYSTWELVMRQVNYFARSRLSGMYFKERVREGEKFVLYPLHYTDDAQITVKYPIYSQLELIEKIAKVLPAGMWLYVKPHPHWRSCDLPLSVMSRMAKIPKVRLLGYSESTKGLIRKAKFTAMINSSVGMESLLAGKPVVAFGIDYPADIIPRVKDITGMADAAYNRQAKKERVKEWIAHLHANSVFMVDDSYSRTADFTIDEDAKNLVEGIVKCYGMAKREGKDAVWRGEAI